MVPVNIQQATKAISARSDVGGPFIDFIHYTAYHKSHMGSRLLTRGASGYSSLLGNLSVYVCIFGQAESTPSVQNSSKLVYIGFI